MANYNPSFTLYKANAKGNGSAISLNLSPATDEYDGGFFVKLAAQKTVGDARGPNPTFPSFDWDDAIKFKLGFNDITQMLQVFRGETEEVNEGNGLYIRCPKYNVIVKFKHVLEYRPGYSMEVKRNTPGKPEEDKCVNFFFSSAEALGLSVAFENSLGVICFGVPRVIEKSE